MGPNKKSKSSKAASSSSSSSYDTNKFVSAQADANYISFLTKNIPQERGMRADYPDGEVMRNVEERGWLSFVEQPGPAVVPLVREFYANLKEDETGAQILTYVRGKRVRWDRWAINEFFGVHDIENDEYSAYLEAGPDLNAIIAALCPEGAEWRRNDKGEAVTFKSKHLHETGKSWFAFISARLIPSGHLSDVTKDRAKLLYAILTGLSINVGSIIRSSILGAVRGSTTIGLPHPSLITELCRHAGVVWGRDEELLRPLAPILVTRGLRDPIPRPRRPSAASSSSQARARAPRTIPDRLTAIEERLDNQDHRLEEIYQQQRRFMEFTSELSAALDHRLPSSDPNAPPFPQPWIFPQHPPAPDDDEMGGDH